jgi:leader peptidase (prepilin peptidase)/N-methyltransferase
LGVLDLFPVISHLFLGGRCRYCGVPVSLRYSTVEIITSLFFSLSFYVFGLTPAFFVNTALICSLIVISFIDLDCQIIPDEISIGGTIVGLLTALMVSIYPAYMDTGLKIGILDSFLGFGVGFTLLYAISVSTGGGMGGGDVKLAGMLGAFLGMKGVLVTLLIACIFGAIGGILLIVTRLKSRKDLIPFGPYIAIGAILVIFLGSEKIISTYLSLLKFG